MKRKILSLVLAFVMLMSCCFTGTASHVHAVGTEPTIVVSEVKAEAGKTAAVSISLENNPGIVNMILKVEYDTEVLTLVDVLDAGIFGETVHKPELQSPYTLCWANDTVKENFTITGTIVTLFFKVAETASEGDVAEVKAYYDYDRNEIVDKDMQKVRFEIDNGSVTVGQPEANPISDFTYELSGTEMTITSYTGGARDVIIGSKYTVGGVEYTVVAIAAEAFVENTEITSVVIPETVKEIGEAAFYDCTSLTEVTVLSEDAEIGEVALGYYYISRREDGVVEGFTIKGYPGSTAEDYADAEPEITFVALDKPCEHTGGEATCKDQAICTKCEQPYGKLDPNKHKNTEVRDAANPSCNENGYTGDTWCKDCNTKTATGTSIPATGDHKDADGDWEVNQTHHFHTCGCGTEFDRAAHSGGTATCKEKAICSVCGTAHGNLDSSNHAGSTYLVGQKEATCYEEGYTGDTFCSDCDQKIATGTTIKTDSHNPASVWTTDETHHWKECQTIGCGNLIDKAAHSGGEATCKNKAICSVCNAPYGNLSTTNHKNTEIRDAADPSCNEDGYTGDTWCKDCNTKIATGTSIPATGDHVDADNKWEYNGTQHFHTCACGTKFDYTNHTGGEATCKVQANCSICGAAYGELSATNHKDTEIRDAATPSCSENGYTGDTWCKDCNTKIATGISIPATGDHVDADNKWEYNDTQHFHTCACSTKFDYANHTGGTATCKDKATCSTCGVAYGNLDATNHKNTEVRDAATASCNVDGYTGDTWCKDCNTKIATGTSIPATGDHVDADNKWEHNDTLHFHTCACGTKFDYANHSGGTATCKDKASCSVCGVAYGNVDASNHTGGTYLVGQKEASCFEEGYTGDTYCSGCDQKIATGTAIGTNNHNPASVWSTDETHHWKECQTIGCGNLIDKAEHSGGEATCKAKAVCSVCSVAYGEVKADNHKNTEIRDAVEATCTVPGYTGDTWCKDCNTKIATGTEIPAAHKTVKVPAVEATHEKDGNIEYFTCSGCDKLFADEAATTVITIEDTVVAKGEHSYGDTYEKDAENHWKVCSCGNIAEKAAHTFGDWTVTKEATTTEKGSKEKTCSVCGYKMVEEIPVIEDSGDNTPDNPQTGDNSNLLLWIALLFVSGSALILTFGFSKKRTRHSR